MMLMFRTLALAGGVSVRCNLRTSAFQSDGILCVCQCFSVSTRLLQIKKKEEETDMRTSKSVVAHFSLCLSQYPGRWVHAHLNRSKSGAISKTVIGPGTVVSIVGTTMLHGGLDE